MPFWTLAVCNSFITSAANDPTPPWPPLPPWFHRDKAPPSPARCTSHLPALRKSLSRKLARHARPNQRPTRLKTDRLCPKCFGQFDAPQRVLNPRAPFTFIVFNPGGMISIPARKERKRIDVAHAQPQYFQSI